MVASFVVFGRDNIVDVHFLCSFLACKDVDVKRRSFGVELWIQLNF